MKRKVCAICGKKLNPPCEERGVGDRCLKAAHDMKPHLFKDGVLLVERITEDDRFEIMRYMQGVSGSGKRVCICSDDDGVEIKGIELGDDECECNGDVCECEIPDRRRKDD